MRHKQHRGLWADVKSRKSVTNSAGANGDPSTAEDAATA